MVDGGQGALAAIYHLAIPALPWRQTGPIRTAPEVCCCSGQGTAHSAHSQLVGDCALPRIEGEEILPQTGIA